MMALQIPIKQDLFWQKIKQWAFPESKGWRMVPTYQINISWLFLRGLGLIYFAAFASLALQIEGLIGSDGILPISAKLRTLESLPAFDRYRLFPTFFWLDTSNSALYLICYSGLVAATLLTLNLGTRASLVLCYLLYLSLVTAGQDFTAFQWDGLLLEAGFLGIFLTWGSAIIIFLYRWLIARFMLMAGIVKLASGDPSWANLTALNYHYLTQPLPSPLAYYAYFLPDWFHRICIVGVFFIELVVPFFVFFPRRFRLFAAWSFIILQCSIIATGNYGFFNLLTLLLCLFLFEDRDIEKFFPQQSLAIISGKKPLAGKAANAFAGTWAFLVFFLAATHTWIYHTHKLPATPIYNLIKTISAFAVINNYGPFAIMTTVRAEIIIEGSNDGKHWLEYGFKYKPDRLTKLLSYNIPHQPRLDWQMWFAALAAPQKPLWLQAFLDQLQLASPAVLALLAYNPFPENPPKYLRTHLYQYTYSTPEQRLANGQVWQRQSLYIY